MDLKNYLRNYVRTAATLPALLQDWDAFLEEQREDAVQDLIELLSARFAALEKAQLDENDAAVAQLAAADEVFRRLSPRIEHLMGVVVADFLKSVSTAVTWEVQPSRPVELSACSVAA